MPKAASLARSLKVIRKTESLVGRRMASGYILRPIAAVPGKSGRSLRKELPPRKSPTTEASRPFLLQTENFFIMRRAAMFQDSGVYPLTVGPRTVGKRRGFSMGRR